VIDSVDRLLVASEEEEEEEEEEEAHTGRIAGAFGRRSLVARKREKLWTSEGTAREKPREESALPRSYIGNKCPAQ